MIAHLIAHLIARPAGQSAAMRYDGALTVRTILPHGRGVIVSRILADGREVIDAAPAPYLVPASTVPAPRPAPVLAAVS